MKSEKVTPIEEIGFGPDGTDSRRGLFLNNGYTNMSRWLFLPDSTVKDLGLLSRLSGEQIGVLRSILDLAEPDNPYVLYVMIAERVGVTDQEAASFYNFWRYVQGEKRDCERNAASVVDEFVSFLEAKEALSGNSKSSEYARYRESIEEKRDAVESLFGDYLHREHAQKSHALEAGPLPHISSLKAYCDLRPVYDRDGERITDCVPVITLRVAIHDVLGEHKEFFVQLSESNISMLELELKRLRKKLAVLKEVLPAITPHRPGEDEGGRIGDA